MHKDSFKISWILKTSSPFYATFEGKRVNSSIPVIIHHICRKQVVDLNPFLFLRERLGNKKDTHDWSMDMPCPLFVCFKAGIKTPDFVVLG